MKKLACALATGLALGLAFGAGFLAKRFLPAPSPETETVPPADEKQPAAEGEKHLPPPPGYALKPARHNFGKLFEGEARTVELSIERPADKAVRMGRLYSPCPCVRVEAAALSVDAGKPAKVTVVLHSLTLEGKKSFPVYVELLDSPKGVLRADVDVNVERVPARIMLVPEAFHFGSVREEKTAATKLVNLTKRPLRIEEISTVLAGASVETKTPKSLAPGESAELVLKLNPANLAAGPVRGEVLVRTDSPVHASMKIPVDGTAVK